MISRLTTIAAVFAVLTTASLAFAATSYQHAGASAQKLPVVELQQIVVTGKRLPKAA